MSSIVSISLGDLQEMQNHMRESIDQGLQELQSKEGKGEVPAAPPSAKSQPVPALYASAAPPPDANVAAEIQQQAIEADRAETEVASAASEESGVPVVATPSAPRTIALGQTPEEVTAALGAPPKVADLGPGGMIYYYDGMKVIFKDGRVSSVK
jgi:TolA-binding protein